MRIHIYNVWDAVRTRNNGAYLCHFDSDKLRYFVNSYYVLCLCGGIYYLYIYVFLLYLNELAFHSISASNLNNYTA